MGLLVLNWLLLLFYSTVVHGLGTVNGTPNNTDGYIISVCSNFAGKCRCRPVNCTHMWELFSKAFMKAPYCKEDSGHQPFIKYSVQRVDKVNEFATISKSAVQVILNGTSMEPFSYDRFATVEMAILVSKQSAVREICVIVMNTTMTTDRRESCETGACLVRLRKEVTSKGVLYSCTNLQLAAVGQPNMSSECPWFLCEEHNNEIIIGAVVGVILLVIIAGCCYCCAKQSRQQNTTNPTDSHEQRQPLVSDRRDEESRRNFYRTIERSTAVANEAHNRHVQMHLEYSRQARERHRAFVNASLARGQSRAPPWTPISSGATSLGPNMAVLQ